MTTPRVYDMRSPPGFPSYPQIRFLSDCRLRHRRVEDLRRILVPAPQESILAWELLIGSRQEWDVYDVVLRRSQV